MSKCYGGLCVFFLVVIFLAVSCMVSAAKVRLAFITPAGPMYGITAKDMAGEYMKRHPDIEVMVDSFPFDEYITRIAMDVAGGGGTYDVVWFDFKMLGGYVRSNYLLSLENYLSKDPEFRADVEEDFVPIQLKTNTYERELYGIPCYADSTMMFYRKDVLAKAGLGKPKSYDDILEAAPKIHNPPKMYAIGGHYQRFWAGDAWFAILWPAGGEIWDENYVPHLDSPAALKAARLFEKLVKWAPREALNWGEGDVNDAMGSAGIIAIAPSTWSSTVAADPKTFKFAPVIGVSPSPGVDGVIEGASSLGGFALGIGKFSPHQDEAWKFIKWFTARENQEMYLNFGAHPARISILTSPVAKDPAFPVLVEAMKRAGARPNIPEWATAEHIIGVELDKIITEEKTPEEALHDMNKAVYDVLKETGRIKE